MAQAKAQKRVVKELLPNWEKIMQIMGTPNQSAVYVDSTNWNGASNPGDFANMDGAWDPQAAQKGFGMRRIAADIGKTNGPIDIPSGIPFVCVCGYARRVVDSEHAFTCERPNPAGGSGCGVIWQKDSFADEEDINPRSGNPVWKVHTEERTATNGRKYLMPRIKGYSLADWRFMKKEAIAARTQEEREAAEAKIEAEAELLRSMPTLLTPPEGAKE